MLFLDGERDTTIKLLVVDTDRNLVEMLTGWLKTLGYEVHRAYTGKQAMREWGEHQPDLIILDPLLNDVDALAMCREVRSEHDALVIVVTDGKDVHDEIRCLESGADDYLRKPFCSAFSANSCREPKRPFLSYTATFFSHHHRSSDR